MIKKIATVVLAAGLVVSSLAGCGKKTQEIIENKSTVVQEDEKKDGKKLKVVTTIFPPYDFVKNIGDSKIEVTALVKPGAEIHSYEPTPTDIKLVSEADLFIYTGGENDVWVEDILGSIDKKPMKTLKMVDLVDALNEVIVEGMEHSHTHEEHDHEDHAHEEHDHEEHAHEEHDHEDHAHEEHDHGDNAHEEHNHEGHAHEEHNHESHKHEEHDHELDEHVWTSPKNALKIANAVYEVMKELSPEDAEYFEANYKSYASELEALDKELAEVISNGKRNLIVVADRFPFLYLAKHYGLEYYAAFSGCSTDTEAKPTTITFLINKVKEEGIKTVFKIEMSDGKLADAVCEATGAKAEVLHSAHNLSKEEIEQGIDYISLMRKNIELLKEALNN